MDKGLAHRFLDAFTDFLLVAALVAFVSSFFPLIPTVIPSAFLPVGSLSVPLIGFLYLYFRSMVIASVTPSYGPLLGLVLTILVLAAAFKAFVYRAVRGNKVLRVSAAWVLLAHIVLILFIFIWGYLSPPAPKIWVYNLLRYAASVLLVTLPADLAGLSYMKFRDAVKGGESPKWVLALAALWTALLVVFLTELLPLAAFYACYEPHTRSEWSASLLLYITAWAHVFTWFVAMLLQLIRGHPGALLSILVIMFLTYSFYFCDMPAAAHVTIVITLVALQTLYAALYTWLRVLRKTQAE